MELSIRCNNNCYPPNELSSTVADLPEWIKLGLGDQEYICHARNATFSGQHPPQILPDISKHGNHMAEVLRSDPSLYVKLKDKTTSYGVGLGKCIKPGIDNPGHPFIKTVGLVAGDEESYELFKELFDPVIYARHRKYPADAQHKADMDITKINPKRLDPSGKYVLTSRVRTGRSIRGYRLPPAVSFEERRELEKLLVSALLKLSEDLAGDYYPLHGSRSYKPKPNGMTKDMEKELRSRGQLFQAPDSTLLLSSGCGRHWPDARGIFHNKDKNALVWVNEEDHLRIISMENGDDIQGVFKRIVRLINRIENAIREESKEFMYNDHLGYILTCPSNLGTGLRVGVFLKIPLVLNRSDFKEMLASMGLQARGVGGVDTDSKDGVVDISNSDRLGKSEIELLNIVIDGIIHLVELEQTLEKEQLRKVQETK